MLEQNILGCLVDRQLIEITGTDAASFLQGLITTDIRLLHQNIMMAGALLSPQGKVLFDFLIGKEGNGFFIDTSQTLSEALVKRMNLYKLRSQVEITLHEPYPLVISQTASQETAKFCFHDARFGDGNKIMRLYVPAFSLTNDEKQTGKRQAWDRLRIKAALAESSLDFTLGDVFAHDINLDQIGGVSFNKGCYIGQEVVSRMQHRATARRRLVHVLTHERTHLPPSGTIIEAAGKQVGVLGSHIEDEGLSLGLAIIRLDRVKAALDKGQKITADGVGLTLKIPEQVNFTYPDGQDGGKM